MPNQHHLFLPLQTEVLQQVHSVYKDACSQHGMHTDPRVMEALAAACRGAEPVLCLRALTLGSEEDAGPLVAAVKHCAHVRGEGMGDHAAVCM